MHATDVARTRPHQHGHDMPTRDKFLKVNTIHVFVEHVSNMTRLYDKSVLATLMMHVKKHLEGG